MSSPQVSELTSRSHDPEGLVGPASGDDFIGEHAGNSLSESVGKHSQNTHSILYEAKTTFEIFRISENISDLLGLDRESIIKSRSFWQGWLFDMDLPLIEEKLHEFGSMASISFVHRFFNSARLPIWVVHSIRKAMGLDGAYLSGCVVPVTNDRRIYALDQSLIDRFVHKLGNHFQLLNLVVGALKKDLPESRDAKILLETLDKTAELTRSFAESSQVNSWLSKIQLVDVLKGSVENQRQVFLSRDVPLHESFEKSIDEATLPGDPFLLESALNHISVELLDSATPSGAPVEVEAWISHRADNAGVATVRFIRSQDAAVFKEPDLRGDCSQRQRTNHDGLGITLAARLLELHGGFLTENRMPNGGILVEIRLPITLERSSA